MRILLIDNYDSFTYNLFHYLEQTGEHEIKVIRNDQLSLSEVGDYDKILLSPGPGLPKDAGNILDVIHTYAHSKSILGVCLGHQAIAEAFGGKLRNLKVVQHGISTPVRRVAKELMFTGIPDIFEVGRYHSWVMDETIIPENIKVTARDNENIIMAIRHTQFDVSGVQFHPESIMTPFGLKMIDNWVNLPNK